MKNVSDIKIRANFTLDQYDIELLNKFAGKNKSAFLSKIIKNSLGTREQLKKRYIAELGELQEKLRSINFDLEIVLDPKKEKGKVVIEKKEPKEITQKSNEVD